MGSTAPSRSTYRFHQPLRSEPKWSWSDGLNEGWKIDSSGPRRGGGRAGGLRGAPRPGAPRSGAGVLEVGKEGGPPAPTQPPPAVLVDHRAGVVSFGDGVGHRFVRRAPDDDAAATLVGPA